MTLGAPLALLGLALVPLLLLLERLRRRPRTVLVASLALWREVAPDLLAPVARRRRRSRRLWLRIAAVALLTLAGAGPALTAVRPAASTLYALVDRSPGMGAGDRLERAMGIVSEAAAPFDRVRVLFSPPGPVLREGEPLTAPAPADRGEPLGDAVAGLLGLAGGDTAARALLVTDRLPAALEGTPGLAVALVGRRLPNAGVTDLSVDREGDGWAAFVAWEGFGEDAPGLSLLAGGEVVERWPGGPGGRTGVRRLPGDVREVEARLEGGGDALPADDRARAVRTAEQPSLGLLGDERPEPLALALRAVLGDGLVEGAPTAGGGIAWRTAPPPDAPGAWILVRPPAPFRGFEPGEAGSEPVPASRVLVEEPALAPAFPAGLPPDLVLGPADGIRAPADARVLLRASGGPPLALAAADGRTVVLPFDPADPRFPFARSGAHVVLWRALLDLVAGPTARFEPEGLLDATESDLRGEERPPDPVALVPRAGTGVVVRERSLRGPLAALGLLAVAALLATGRRGRDGEGS